MTKLVALGHEIAAMGDADRKAVEGVVSSSVSSIHRKPETKDVYAGYQAVWGGAMSGGDQDFFNKIKSLNILTQYAFFDLLRKQEPEEADRLGSEPCAPVGAPIRERRPDTPPGATVPPARSRTRQAILLLDGCNEPEILL